MSTTLTTPRRKASRRPVGPRIAFWSYDLFPFIVSGTVTGKPDADGRLRMKGRGAGQWYEPSLILPEAQGHALQAAIEALTEERSHTVGQMERGFRARLAAILPPELAATRYAAANLPKRT